MSSFNLGKYKGIIVSIALFLLLDASVLMLNFYISFEISEDAESVNLAGRQRMLSQRTMKALLDIDTSQTDPQIRDRALEELKITTSLFNNTLIAFTQGGATQSAQGQPTYLNPVTSVKSVNALVEANQLWQPYWLEIKNLLSAEIGSTGFEGALIASTRYGRENNLKLLKLMNDLTVDLENAASSQATRLRVIQTIGISLAIINFFIIMFHFLKQLRESDSRIAAAQKETQEILETVNDGLFLIDKDLVVGAQQSESMKSIFSREQISETTFENLLKDIVSAKDLNTAKNFVALLFKPEIKENLIGDLNPLTEIEVSLSNSETGIQRKYLSFNFSRVTEENEASITHVLVTVRDVTRRVQLAKELEHMNTRNEQQFEMLTQVIHTNPDTLSTYIDNAYRTFNKINLELKNPAKNSGQYITKANHIFILIHNFKGDSSALTLSQFADQAHEFENQIEALKTNPNITGNDFLSLTVSLNQLISQMDNLRKLTNKLFQFKRSMSSQDNHVKQDWSHLTELANNTASNLEKRVELITTGLNDKLLEPDQYTTINTVLVQLIRNAIAHGIESTEIRNTVNKNPVGIVRVQLSHRRSGDIEILVKDDGIGLNFEKIRHKAIDKNLVTAAQAKNLSQKQMLSLIFEPGFSTYESATADAGRGVGMSAVRETIKSAGGRISVNAKNGVGTTFSITLPASSMQKQEVA